MRNKLATLLMLSMVVVGSVAVMAAEPAPRMLVNVPFAFQVDDQLLPAGEYWFEVSYPGSTSSTGTMLMVRSKDGSIFRFLPGRITGSHGNGQAAGIAFNRYNSSYFLSQINLSGMTASIPKSRGEKDLSLSLAANTHGPSIGIVSVGAKDHN